MTDQAGHLRQLLVKETVVAAVGVVELVLVDPDGRELPPWTPGAHVDVELPSGVRRTYSLCGDPDDTSWYRIAVLRVEDGGGGSRELHEVVAGPGAPTLMVGSPRNNFELLDAPSYLFIAGGIGITPLLPMVRAASAARRDWRLVYGGRERGSMAFVPELEATSGGLLDLRPEDAHGLLPLADLLTDLDESTLVYVCGPTGLLDACQALAEQSGLAGRLHLERFAASRDGSDDEPNASFEVDLRRSDVTLEIGPEDSILDKVLEVRPGHPWSCHEGTCGSCETTVLEGEVEHRDEILDDEERAANDTMFICVSRCRGRRLVLDL